MKLVRYGEAGREKPGLVDAQGQVRDLSSLVPDIIGATLSSESLNRIRQADPSSLPVAPAGQRLGACVGQVRNFIAIGLNYADHAAETGAAIPAEPIVFNKAPSCIVGPNDDVIIPRGSQKTDWEVELAIVIGERASYVGANEALNFVAGYCVCNDVSEREFQIERGGTWTKGKGCPTFGPLGPWMVTKDEIPDPQNLSMWLDVNGERVQNGSTKTMIFNIAQIVSYVSHFMILEPGDVITTGTPPGVGMGMKPQRFLKAGDVVSLGIEGLGEQRQRFVAYEDNPGAVDASKSWKGH
ncbi:2-keto-4-pentenoate hydratase/2-oxohepta-3-ene-1,7-dioic acid hydratase in catechol pathway [Microvirga lupini]|uniref:2-keto-4-pentenoate hydratase/2-oxohepta-3-ene-1,7-dioic acid hydratase in catechol pathway n=1 Tax=Microvirga lupini TaxID=420324 RepID=A0A7W4VLG3_9HYPH|nr:fumarylacetoacetate hydrolase family protein [Microvirga lupini]MBB3019362.1 2-keto-4-pentenoate hydratase/2-oxohepta-3-ene-1,7-dioic acid hydratase in catechol pathway [Microvirga lupini]